MKTFSGIIMLIGIAISVIVTLEGMSEANSAIQQTEVVAESLFFMIGAYITGRALENFSDDRQNINNSLVTTNNEETN